MTVSRLILTTAFFAVFVTFTAAAVHELRNTKEPRP